MKDKRDNADDEHTSGDTPFYRLRLFVAGDEPNSRKAKSVLKNIYNKHLRNRCEMQIIDVFEDHRQAIEKQLYIIPALIIEEPPPQKIIVSSLDDENTVLVTLGILNKRGNYEKR